MSAIWGLIKGGVGALVPGAGIAMKLGPWVIIAALAGVVLILRADLGRDRARIITAQTQAAQAVDRCQKDAAVTVAAENAASAAALAQAQATANAATYQLMNARRTAAAAAGLRRQAVAESNAQIDEQAALPGQDGPIPLILAEQYK